MKHRKVCFLLAILFAVGTLAMTEKVVLAESVQRMSVDQLKEVLGRPDVLVLDARRSSDWKDGETKIKGAVRMEADQIADMAAQTDKARTVVLYCA